MLDRDARIAFTEQEVKRAVNLDYSYVAHNADGGVYLLTATDNPYARPVRWGVFFFSAEFIADLLRAQEVLPMLTRDANISYIGFLFTSYVIEEYRLALNVLWERLRRRTNRNEQLPVVARLQIASCDAEEEATVTVTSTAKMLEPVITPKIKVRTLEYLLSKGMMGGVTSSDQGEKAINDEKGKKP